MGMQLSIDQASGKEGRGKEEHLRGAGAVWIGAQAGRLIDRLQGIARGAIERLRNVQSCGTKRRQMRLVESLALGNRRQLLLVVCDNHKYLVGAGADSVGSILAVDAATASRDRAALGPELVRRRGRNAYGEARSKVTDDSRLDLWH